MERTMAERLTAEFVGALTLTFIAAGSIVVAATGGSNVVGVALAYGLAVAVMVSALAHISGAHFNPAITIGALVAAKIKSKDAIGYIVAQLAGAAAGAALLRAAIPKTLLDNQTVQFGTPFVTRGISNGQAVLIEAVLTFFLVWVVFATAVDPEGASNKIAGLAIGFVITMGVLMGEPFTRAAMNPARHFGPAIVGGGWTNWWVYWVGPIAGGIVAASLYDGLMIRRPGSVAADEAPYSVGAPGEDSEQ